MIEIPAYWQILVWRVLQSALEEKFPFVWEANYRVIVC
jgi:hypothetical protein